MTLLYALTIGFDAPPGRAAAVPVRIDLLDDVEPAEGMTWGEFAAAQFVSAP